MININKSVTSTVRAKKITVGILSHVFAREVGI